MRARACLTPMREKPGAALICSPLDLIAAPDRSLLRSSVSQPLAACEARPKFSLQLAQSRRLAMAAALLAALLHCSCLQLHSTHRQQPYDTRTALTRLML